jgi:hypothetical protein
MFAYNTATHASHKFTPFELQHGRQARVPLDLMHPSDKIELYLTPESYAAKLQDELPTVYEHVAKNIEMAVLPNKIRHDRKCRAATFVVGDYCWLLDTATLKGVSKKLSHRFKGPYRVVQVIDDANFKLKTLTGRKTIIVNKSRLKRCYERKILQEMDDNNLLDQTNSVGDNPMVLDNTQDPQPTPNTPVTRRKKKPKANRTKLPKYASNSKKHSTTTTNTSEQTQNESGLNKDHVEVVPNNTNTSNTRQNLRPLRTRQKPDRFQAGN